jgi:hypothetical protein
MTPAQAAELFNASCLALFVVTYLTTKQNSTLRLLLPSPLLCFVAYLLGGTTFNLPKEWIPVWGLTVRDMLFLNPLIVCIVFGMSFSHIRRCAAERLETMSLKKEENINNFHANFLKFLRSDEGFAMCFSFVLVAQYLLVGILASLYFGFGRITLSSLQVVNVLQVTIQVTLFLCIPILLMVWEYFIESKNNLSEIICTSLCITITIMVAVPALFDYSHRPKGVFTVGVISIMKMVASLLRMGFCASATMPAIGSLFPAKVSQSQLRRQSSFEF